MIASIAMPEASCRSDVSLVLGQHTELRRVLMALRKVCAAQLAASSEAELESLLGYMQVLLDSDEMRQSAELFRQSAEIAASLRVTNPAAAADIREALQCTRRMFSDLAADEEQVRRALQTELEALGRSLGVMSRQQQARHAYGVTAAPGGPRFLNGLQ